MLNLSEKLLGGLKSFLLSDDEKALLNSTVNVSANSHRESAKGVEVTKNHGDTTVNVTNNTYNFVLPDGADRKISEDEKREIQQLILDSFQDGGLRAIYKPSTEILNDYHDFERNAGYSVDVVEQLRGVLSENDLMIIRTGFYLKHLSDEGRVEELVRIRDGAVRNDPRTRNILNLVTAGYFEEHVLPILKTEEKDKALAYYDEVVMYLPEIIFVHSEMCASEVVERIRMKIRQREKYHVVTVRQIIVSGIGNQCVRTISEAQAQVIGEYQELGYEVSFQTSSGALSRVQLWIKFPEISH